MKEVFEQIVDERLAKIEFYMQHHRFDEAEKEIKALLTENPDADFLYFWLGLVLINLQRTDEAFEAVKSGIGLNPASPFGFYVLSRCYIKTDENEKAEEAIVTALKFDPNNADYLTVYAVLLADRGEKDKALEQIDEALRVDPENSDAKRYKSTILSELGKHEEADQLVTESLHDDPEDSASYVQKGHTLLALGKNKEALDHFKQAIMLEPNSDYAKSGLVLGLKAQNRLFDWFYRHSQWIGRLSSKTRIILAVSIIFVLRYINKAIEVYPDWAPLFYSILACYFVFVFLAWTMDNIFNCVLRLNSYGKYALSRGEVIGSNIFIALTVGALIQFGLYFLTNYPLAGGIGTVFLVLPFMGANRFWGTASYRKQMIYCFVFLGFLVLSVVADLMGSFGIAILAYYAVLFGTAGYTWFGSKLT